MKEILKTDENKQFFIEIYQKMLIPNIVIRLF